MPVTYDSDLKFVDYGSPREGYVLARIVNEGCPFYHNVLYRWVGDMLFYKQHENKIWNMVIERDRRADRFVDEYGNNREVRMYVKFEKEDATEKFLREKSIEVDTIMDGMRNRFR